MYRIIDFDPEIKITKIVLGLDSNVSSDYYYPGEMHDFWEIITVYKGELTTTSDEMVYTLKPGNMLLYKPLCFHRLWSSGKEHVHFKNISFIATGDSIAKLDNGPILLNNSLKQQFSEVTNSIIKVNQIDREKNYDNALFTHTASLAANQLENLLLNLLTYDNKNKEYFISNNEKQYKLIVSIIEKNIEKSLSVAEIADLCNLSVSNMKRIFSIYNDNGIAKYFIILKMRYAMQLLKEGIACKQVANQIGFNEVSYFFTVFKRETGMTPNQFKKLV